MGKQRRVFKRPAKPTTKRQEPTDQELRETCDRLLAETMRNARYLLQELIERRRFPDAQLDQFVAMLNTLVSALCAPVNVDHALILLSAPDELGGQHVHVLGGADVSDADLPAIVAIGLQAVDATQHTTAEPLS